MGRSNVTTVESDVARVPFDAALEKGRWQEATRLYRSDDAPEVRCWLRVPGWCLAYS